MRDSSIYIGYVAKTHGLNGDFSIKLQGTKEFCQLCLNIKNIYLERDNNPLIISQTQINAKIFLRIKVKSIRTREDAKLLLTQNVYIKKGDILEIDKLIKTQNELTNFEVIDENAKVIGIIDG